MGVLKISLDYVRGFFMFDDVMTWLGAGWLEPSVVLLLLLVSVLASFMTAAFGIGGGVLLLVSLASILPVSALIPVHGLIQLGSNGNRAVMTRHHIDWSMVKFFGVGAVLGAVLASLIVVQLPLQWIQLAVAGFILFLVWGPKPQKQELSVPGRVISGGVTTLVSMFVGATGPLVAGLVHRGSYDKMTHTATFASCMTLQHCLKGGVFVSVGFAFWQWLPFISVMIVAGVVGSWLGLKALDRIPAVYFKGIFRVVITLMALRLAWQALMAFV